MAHSIYEKIVKLHGLPASMLGGEDRSEINKAHDIAHKAAAASQVVKLSNDQVTLIETLYVSYFL